MRLVDPIVAAEACWVSVVSQMADNQINKFVGERVHGWRLLGEQLGRELEAEEVQWS